MSLADFQQTYEYSPITLVGGVAQNMPGGQLPIIILLQAAAFPNGLTGGSTLFDPNTMFAKFRVPPGGTLIVNESAEFPLANQTVAANAQIVDPLTFSLVMVAPANEQVGYSQKLAIMTALKATLDQHTATGGTYNVATPAFIYQNTLLMALEDVSGEDTTQVQTEWEWRFRMPLLTLQQALQAQNTLVSKLSGQQQLVGSGGAISWSGPQNAVGQPQGLTTLGVLPGASGTTSAGVAASGPLGASPVVTSI